MSHHRPRISIGLPVYNGAQFLRETLNSLLAQTYSDFELIISDNASTDETEPICREYLAKDGRIQYHRNNKNLGLARNYNRLFELSTGEYFKWTAADDVCKPDYLARCVDILDGDPTVVLAYPKTCFIDVNGNVLDLKDPGWDLRSEAAHKRLRNVIYAGHWVNAIFGLTPANALSKTRLIPSYPGGDYRFLGELSLLGKFYEIPEVLFFRRIHPAASSQNTTNREWLVKLYKGESGHICLPFWNLGIDQFTTIMRSELSIGQKLSLVGSLLRRMHWDQRRLLQELQVAFKTYINRILFKISRS